MLVKTTTTIVEASARLHAALLNVMSVFFFCCFPSIVETHRNRRRSLTARFVASAAHFASCVVVVDAAAAAAAATRIQASERRALVCETPAVNASASSPPLSVGCKPSSCARALLIKSSCRQLRARAHIKRKTRERRLQSRACKQMTAGCKQTSAVCTKRPTSGGDDSNRVCARARVSTRCDARWQLQRRARAASSTS